MCSGGSRRSLVLATNRNSGMLQLNASHDDDDDADLSFSQGGNIPFAPPPLSSFPFFPPFSTFPFLPFPFFPFPLSLEVGPLESS